jgi:membrane protease YdiL (CAAX protease family)
MSVPEGAVSRGGLLVLALGVEYGLALAALGLGWLTGVNPLAGLRGTWRDVLLGLAVASPLLLLFRLAQRSRWRPLVALREQVEGMVRFLFARAVAIDLVYVAVAAGVGEELFFRGWLQPWLARPLGPAGGLALASLLFGLAHPHSAVYVAMAATIGLVLGGLAMATGSLVGPIVAHAAYDLVALVWLTQALRRRDAAPAVDP